jgi:hypothetical protein
MVRRLGSYGFRRKRKPLPESPGTDQGARGRWRCRPATSISVGGRVVMSPSCATRWPCGVKGYSVWRQGLLCRGRSGASRRVCSQGPLGNKVWLENLTYRRRGRRSDFFH